MTVPLTNVNNLKAEATLLEEVNINYLKKTEHRQIKDMIVIEGFKQLTESPTWITAKPCQNIVKQKLEYF